MKTCPHCGVLLKTLSGHHFACKEMGWRESESGKIFQKKVNAPRAHLGKQIWSEERKKRHSERMQKISADNPGSYQGRYNRGSVRNVSYKGFILHGSWELEVAKWLDSQGISWTRPSRGISYFWNGSWRKYYPDFELEDGTLVEIKGYETDRDRAKWNATPGLIVIKSDRMKILSTSVLADFR